MKKIFIKKISPLQSRNKYYNNYNFKFHIDERLRWMRKYVKNKKVIEIGSGNGLSKKILDKKIITSDIFKADWINLKINMDNFKLSNKFINNIDVFMFNHSLHHSKNPLKVLKQIKKYLKKNGLILINDPEISIVFKVFLKIFHHETWTFEKNKWKNNNATSYILFNNKEINSIFNTDFVIKKNDLSECAIFLNSSGSSVNSLYIPLNKLLLKTLQYIDKILVIAAPRVFAMNRSVILQKLN